MGDVSLEKNFICETTDCSLTNGQITHFKSASAFKPFAIKTVPPENTLKTSPAQRLEIEEYLLLSWILSVYRYQNDCNTTISWDSGSILDLTSPKKRIASTCILIGENDHRSTVSLLTNLKGEIVPVATVTENEEKSGLRTVILADGCIKPSALGESSNERENNEREAQIILTVYIQGHHLWVRPSWNEVLSSQFIALSYAQSLANCFDIVRTSQSISLCSLTGIHEEEKSQIWDWNQILPPLVSTCMHELISQRAKSIPKNDAIQAWDGSLTYREVELFSDIMAGQLLDIGAERNSIIPICFHKSKLTIIAVLAVMKAGCAFVLMDPSQPLERLRTIAADVSAQIMVTSGSLLETGQKIVPKAQILSLADETLEAYRKFDHTGNMALPKVDPSSILYIIFTSGSTGVPKGVVISHETYTSSAIPRAQAVGYHSTSKVLDFASYAFDVSIDSMLCTLMQGGCLCIPSDEDRLNDLNGVIRNMGVTMANMTPSVGRILEEDIIRGLHSLGLGGESVSPRDVANWGKLTRIVIGYGPSECTVGCTIKHSAANGKDYVSIGNPTGACLWIVDPNDVNQLVPIGGIGELLVEGPIVGQGYYNQPDKTKEVFIKDPTWLVEGTKNIKGRNGRLYKTGDLVRYDPDGTGAIVFVGRKDTQVKIRGQRVELGEVEHHVTAQLGSASNYDVIAEVIPRGLVAFIAERKEADRTHVTSSDAVQTILPSKSLQQALEGIESRIGAIVPRYMVPSMYITINHMPLMVSRKVDRKQLRNLAQNISKTTRVGPSSQDAILEPAYKVLKKLWSSILQIGISEISPNSSFLELGGDSVLAMKLVSLARDQGFVFTVSDILSHPILSELTIKTSICTSDEHVNTVTPFSLLPSGWDVADAKSEAIKEIGVSRIEDIYPCLPIQETLIAFSVRSKDAFVSQRVFKISGTDQLAKFKQAWELVINQTPILRTRIVQFEKYGLMQVVLEQNDSWEEAVSLDDYLKEDKTTRRCLNDPLCSLASISDPTTNVYYAVWTIAHALYDGWSYDLILDRVRKVYRVLEVPPAPDFRLFIKHQVGIDRRSSEEYWTQQLNQAAVTQFPPTPYRKYIPKADSRLTRQISIKPQNKTKGAWSFPTVIRGAWALVASHQTGHEIVVIGETFNGRSAAVPSVDRIEGPVITTIPVRIDVRLETTAQDYLKAIHDQAVKRIPHQHLGLQSIRKLGSDAQIACEIKTGFIIQPSNTSKTDFGPDVKLLNDSDASQEAIEFNSYPLMIACSLQNDGLVVYASFDSNLVAVRQMERVLEQFEHALRQLLRTETRAAKLKDIDWTCQTQLDEIWGWNKSSPISKDKTGKLTLYPDLDFSRIIIPWIVRPSDHTQLVPVGSIGELVLEGPLESTDYVEDPIWLVTGSENHRGRGGRVHKTGKSAKYAADGSITLIRPQNDLIKMEDERKLALPTDPSKTSDDNKLSAKETLLKDLWEKLLDLPSSNIAHDDGFFALGGDSIVAMRLVSAVQKAGYSLSVNSIFDKNTLTEMASSIQPLSIAQESSLTCLDFKSFSLMADQEENLKASVAQSLSISIDFIMDILPLSSSQEEDIHATFELPRTSVQYNMLYVPHSVDLNRIAAALVKLVQHHDILRTVFVNLGDRYAQIVLSSLIIPEQRHQCPETTTINDFCQNLSQTDISNPDSFTQGGPLLRSFIIQGSTENAFVFAISHALYDGISLSRLMQQLNTAYRSELLPPSMPFSRFLYYIYQSSKARDIAHWRRRLKGSRLSILAPPNPELGSNSSVFVSRNVTLPAKRPGITLATILTTAWSIVLHKSLGTSDITFGTVSARRSIELPGIESINGPCYGYVPVRVVIQPGMTNSELLYTVQKDRVGDLPFEGLDLRDIASECASWEGHAQGRSVFDSVVHHQDVDYFDEMAFGDGVARVDYNIPAGDAARPWKVVSYLEKDKSTVTYGIVGEQSSKALLEEKLDMLIQIVFSLLEQADEVV
jgi:amino acid adenylation domain-containing protein